MHGDKLHSSALSLPLDDAGAARFDCTILLAVCTYDPAAPPFDSLPLHTQCLCASEDASVAAFRLPLHSARYLKLETRIYWKVSIGYWMD